MAGLFIIGYLLRVIPAQAKTFLSHSIQLLIPGAPGDAADIAARSVAEDLAKIFKPPFIPNHRSPEELKHFMSEDYENARAMVKNTCD